jgi:hypothetical protein
MTARDLGSVLIGTAGIMILALKAPESLAELAVQISQFVEGRIDGGWSALLSVLALVPLLLGLALVWYRELLAARLFPEHEGERDNRGLSTSEIQQSVLFGLGVYFLVYGAGFLLSLAISSRRTETSIFQNPFVYGYLTEIVAGLWLTLGSRGLLGAVVQLRNAGRNRAEHDNVSPPGAV